MLAVLAHQCFYPWLGINASGVRCFPHNRTMKIRWNWKMGFVCPKFTTVKQLREEILQLLAWLGQKDNLLYKYTTLL